MNETVTELIRHTEILHELDVFDARRGVLEAALALGFARDEAHFLVTALTELANNIVFHSLGGSIAVERVGRHAHDPCSAETGIRLVASDRGPGIEDVALALQDGFSTGGSLGCGLSGVGRLMDELDVVSSPGGTRITATLWRRGPL